MDAWFSDILPAVFSSCSLYFSYVHNHLLAQQMQHSSDQTLYLMKITIAVNLIIILLYYFVLQAFILF